VLLKVLQWEAMKTPERGYARLPKLDIWHCGTTTLILLVSSINLHLYLNFYSMLNCELKLLIYHTSIYYIIIIAGKSHYLFMVWFLYDQCTYYTDEEYVKLNQTVSCVN